MTLKDKFVFPLVVYVILYAITVPFIYLVKPYLIPDVISIIHKLAVIAVFLVQCNKSFNYFKFIGLTLI